MSIQIGTYSKRKRMDFTSVSVTIPKARRVKGRSYPYKSEFLEDDFDDIEKTIKRDLDISGHVKLVPTSTRGGRVVVV